MWPLMTIFYYIGALNLCNVRIKKQLLNPSHPEKKLNIRHYIYLYIHYYDMTLIWVSTLLLLSCVYTCSYIVPVYLARNKHYIIRSNFYTRYKNETGMPPRPSYDYDARAAPTLVNAYCGNIYIIRVCRYRRVTTPFWKTIIIVRAINSFLYGALEEDRPGWFYYYIYFPFRLHIAHTHTQTNI